MAALCSTFIMGGLQSSFLGNRAAFQSKPSVSFLKAPTLRVLPITAGVIGPGKKWEHYPLSQNGKPIKVPMHVKKGDTVQIIAGKDKGKVGKISDVLTKTGQVLVEGVNIKTKHVKPTAQGETGQILQRESPIHHSNVMVYSTDKQVRSRVGYKVNADGKKVRFLKKTGEELP